jgi:hypothetical protein
VTTEPPIYRVTITVDVAARKRESVMALVSEVLHDHLIGQPEVIACSADVPEHGVDDPDDLGEIE